MGTHKLSCLLLHLHFFSYLFLICTTFEAAVGKAHRHEESIAKSTASAIGSVPAIYVFGDSYVDPGNNNFIWTFFRLNYPPYGQDFMDRKATGRSNNGRLVTDFLASYLGVKETVPPYLDPKLTIDEMKTGVSFASSGTGYDPITVLRANLISMPRQVEYFAEYKTKLEAAIGKEATEDIVEESLFFVNCGINDIVNDYFKYPIRPLQYTIEEYLQFLILRFHTFIQLLLDQGARKIAIAAVPPMGCAPTMINKFSENRKANRSCIEKVSYASRYFNQLIRQELELFQTKYEDVGAKFIYLDQYGIVEAIIKDPNEYGFDDVSRECCTSKLGLCLPFEAIRTLCPDATKYVFWDFIHLTEKATYFVFDSYRPKIDSITNGIRDPLWFSFN